MTGAASTTRTELAHRLAGGLDVTLMWVKSGGEDKTLVCVCDRRHGAYFETTRTAGLRHSPRGEDGHGNT